jgi:hypothetical protein
MTDLRRICGSEGTAEVEQRDGAVMALNGDGRGAGDEKKKKKKEKQERNHTTQVIVTSSISVCVDVCTNIKCSGRGKERWRRGRDQREKWSKGLRESSRARRWGRRKREREGGRGQNEGFCDFCVLYFILVDIIILIIKC